MHDVDRAWVVLGVVQAKIVAANTGLTKKELAQMALGELGDEAEKLYGLSVQSLLRLANTSLQNLVRIGLVRESGHRFFAVSLEACRDASKLAVILKDSLRSN